MLEAFLFLFTSRISISKSCQFHCGKYIWILTTSQNFYCDSSSTSYHFYQNDCNNLPSSTPVTFFSVQVSDQSCNKKVGSFQLSSNAVFSFHITEHAVLRMSKDPHMSLWNLLHCFILLSAFFHSSTDFRRVRP